MSSASLAVAARANSAPHHHLDSARIVAISAAIALNLAVILIASRPITPSRLSPFQRTAPPQTIRFIDPPAVVPPPPPVEMIPLPHPTATPTTTIKAQPISQPVMAPVTEGRMAAPPVTAPTLVPGTTSPVVAAPATAPVEASLAYLAAPLRFPGRALQLHMQGTVLLRVLVDETGKPLQVSVEHGSGHALLDRSAIEQVMAGWRFQPAIVDGHAVRAWARVPVTFKLR